MQDIKVYVRKGITTAGILCLMLLLVPVDARTEDYYPDPDTYVPTFGQLREHKRTYDDPRPVMKEFGPMQVLPREMYEALTWDVQEMKKSSLISY